MAERYVACAWHQPHKNIFLLLVQELYQIEYLLDLTRFKTPKIVKFQLLVILCATFLYFSIILLVSYIGM